MSVSGPVTQTGKSLMQSVCMLMFKGNMQSTTTTLSESCFYEILEEGNIYGMLSISYIYLNPIGKG